MINDPNHNTTSTASHPQPSRQPKAERKRQLKLLALLISILALVGLYYFLNSEPSSTPPVRPRKAQMAQQAQREPQQAPQQSPGTQPGQPVQQAQPPSQASQPAATGNQPTQQGLPVEAAQVQKGDINVYVTAPGKVASMQSVAVTSRVQGRILNVHFREGQNVKKGELLVEIDPKPFQAALHQAQGQLERDQALLRQAEEKWNRDKKLPAAKNISKDQLQLEKHGVEQYRGIVKIDQGLVETARANLSDCRITSPIDGRVGLRQIDPGNVVAANGNPLVVINQMNPVSVVFEAPAQDLPKIQERLSRNQKLPVEVADRNQTNLLGTGEFLAMDNQVDPDSGAVKIKAVFNNQDNALFPNQPVYARIQVGTLNNATLVPAEAVQTGPKGPFVYLVQDNQTVHAQPIQTEVSDGEQTSVQGLQPGQRIVTGGFDKLREGVQVLIQNTPEEVRSGGSSEK